jgi:HEPN domain-containing protein
VNRSDFPELAELHLEHARALLDARLYSGAYYMCGYAVECALKACICKRTHEFDFYPKPKEYNKAWSHDIENLLAVSGLESEFRAASRADPILDVKEALFAAISDQDHGVFQCIRQLW